MIDRTMSNEDLAVLAQTTSDENIKREALERLYSENLPLIRSFVLPYNQGDNMNDLMQAAFLGIASAVSSYDSTKGRFFSYARFHIKNECLDLLKTSIFSFSLSARSFENLYTYRKCLQELSQELGRVPSDKELCKHMNISQNTLDNLKMLVASPVPLDSPVPLSSGDDEVTFADSIPDLSVNVENDVLDSMNDSRLASDLWSFLQEKIDGRAYDLIRLHYCENKTFAELSEIYNLSRQRIQQIIKNAFETLKSRDSSLIHLLNELESVGVENNYKTSFSRFSRLQASAVEVAVMRRNEKQTELIAKIENEKEKTQKFHYRRYWRRSG